MVVYQDKEYFGHIEQMQKSFNRDSPNKIAFTNVKIIKVKRLTFHMININKSQIRHNKMRESNRSSR